MTTPVSEAEVANTLLPATFTAPMRVSMLFGPFLSPPGDRHQHGVLSRATPGGTKLTHQAQSLTTEAGEVRIPP